MSDNDKLMERIRKCLALSESANEHEASAAMRQARKLMEKAGLTASDVGLFEISDRQVDTEYSRTPEWAVHLAAVVARAFSCTVFHGHRRMRFVGPQACSDVAGYCFEVLHRQLKRSRGEFIKSRLPFAAPAVKRKLGQAFCLGWSSGVGKTVSTFASAITDQQQQAHREYVEKVRSQPVRDAKSGNRKDMDDGSIWAAANGRALGEKVELHQGVAAGERPLALESSMEASQ